VSKGGRLRPRFDRAPGPLESVRLQRVREAVLWPRERFRIRRFRLRGSVGPPPPLVKRRRLIDLANRCGISTVVETGTYLGDTTAYLASRGIHVVTIELEPGLAARARRRFAGHPLVTVLEGDSGTVLRNLVASLEVPALFWLDGHFSGGVTARGGTDSPIVQELEAIVSSPHGPGSVILIDDARCLGGEAYPSLAEVRALLSVGNWTVGPVVDDAIEVLPAGMQSSPQGCRDER